MNFEKYFSVISIFCAVMMFIFFIYINFNMSRFTREANCRVQNEFYRLELNGLIKKKYIDYEINGLHYIEIAENKPMKINLTYYGQTLIFDKISIGDTIYKEENSFKYKIFNKSNYNKLLEDFAVFNCDSTIQ